MCIAHPHNVKKLKMDGRMIEHSVLRSVNVFIVSYVMFFAVSVLLISIDNFDFTTNFTAVAATMNNIGPGLAMVGPTQNFGDVLRFFEGRSDHRHACGKTGAVSAADPVCKRYVDEIKWRQLFFAWQKNKNLPVFLFAAGKRAGLRETNRCVKMGSQRSTQKLIRIVTGEMGIRMYKKKLLVIGLCAVLAGASVSADGANGSIGKAASPAEETMPDEADVQAEEPAVTAEAPAETQVVTEPPQTQAQETEPPQTQAPETQPPQTEPPQTEPPQTEPPQTEPPQTEPPQTETQPATEPPQTETQPATEPPQTETQPETEPPQTETQPVTEPQTEEPTETEPQTQEPTETETETETETDPETESEMESETSEFGTK